MEMTDRRRYPLLFWVLLGLIFAVGLAVRLYDLEDPPLDFHPARQLRSAMIARAIYSENHPELPAWLREMTQVQRSTEPPIEPEVFEHLVAWTYALTGGPNLAVPRLYAITFWIIGAGFLAALALELVGWGGALVAVLFYLAWPYTVIASRAFQPDPLMVTLMIIGIWAAVRWRERGSWGWAVAAGLFSGLSVYTKTVTAFFLAPALVVIVLSACHLRAAVRNRQVWVMALLAVLPYGLYYIDGVYLRGYLHSLLSERFLPQLWLEPAFYLRWISNLGRAAPFEMALMALVGVFLLQRKADRALLLALWAGYFIYGMAVPHHISTHDYYHLPFLPVIALGLGAVAGVLFTHLTGPHWLSHAILAVVLVAALGMEGYTARNILKRSDFREQAATWQALGQTLGPNGPVIGLVSDYGAALRYYGWLNPAIWPTSSDIDWQASLGKSFDFAAKFDELASGRAFFLVTELDELDAQPDLKELLYARYPVFQQGPGYIIFDMRAPKQSFVR